MSRYMAGYEVNDTQYAGLSEGNFIWSGHLGKRQSRTDAGGGGLAACSSGKILKIRRSLVYTDAFFRGFYTLFLASNSLHPS